MTSDGKIIYMSVYMFLLKLKVQLQLLLGNANEGGLNPCCKRKEFRCLVINALYDCGKSVFEAVSQLRTVEAPPSVPLTC